MAKNNNIFPSVLAFEKKLVPSDGYLYGTTWEERLQKKPTPLKLIEKSVRGTISNRLKPTVEKDPLKINAEVEKANLQTVDNCALGEEQDTLHMHFTLKVLGGIHNPCACNNEAFSQLFAKVAQSYVEKEGFRELAKRYAINIANARFLWRNRVGAEKIEVIVNIQGDDKTLTFDATQFSLRNFDFNNADIDYLANRIANALSGKSPYLLINIHTYALIGKAQEVYPSEELVLDKGKGEKSKILYHVDHVAAMHSQKIGNAIRTIDTWYPEFTTANIGPIAVEPYGSVTTLGKAYRTPSDKADFYTLFDKYALGEILSNKEEEHYVMAVLVRGGVFGQSGKEKE